MLENMIWNFFEKTGSIEAYLEYINVKNTKDENKKIQPQAELV